MLHIVTWFQRLPHARGGTAQKKILHLANWSQLMTTGTDYDPPLQLLALAGDVHPNSGPSKYPCSVCFKTSLAKVPATCVQDVNIGYIQDVLVFETLRIIVKPMAGSVPPASRHHSHAHLHNRLVPPTRPQCQT